VHWITPADSTWAFTQFEWSPDSRRLAVSRLSPDYRRKQLVIVADTGGAERLIRADSSGTWIAHNIEPSFSPQWSPDGKQLVFVSVATGWRHVYVADAATSSTRALTSGAFEVQAPVWSPDGRAILAVSTREHLQAPRPVAIDPTNGKTTLLEPLLGSASDAWWPGYMAGPGWSPDGKRIAYALSTSADPYEVRIVSRAGAAYSPPVTAQSSLADGLDPGAVAPLEAVSFPSKDGTTIRGVLFRSRASAAGLRSPALVHMYGGWGQLATIGWNIALKSRLFQYLASRGYTVLVVDPRGSDGYGDAIAHGMWHDAAGTQSDDLAAAAGWLVSSGNADRGRIALFGHSYGGFLTLATMLKAPGVFAAGVLQAGVFDFPLFIPLGVTYASMRFGSEELYTARGRPARHVDQLSVPVLLAHGTGDFNAPHLGSEILVTELMKAGRDFEFISYPGERHDWEHPETARDFVRRVAAFLDRSMPVTPRTP
jgi:dipeptidyl aminopeptidase/acylaminoacyl peptidase